MGQGYYTRDKPASQSNKIIVPWEKPYRIEKKRCTDCRIWKHPTEFYKANNTHDGWCNVCKSCDNARRNDRGRRIREHNKNT